MFNYARYNYPYTLSCSYTDNSSSYTLDASYNYKSLI